MQTPEERLVKAAHDAVRALNQAPRFKVPSANSDSYKIVSELEKALAVYEYARTQAGK